MPQTLDPVALLGRLVAFDTVSARSNLALIDFVRDYLDGLGVESHLVLNEDGTKANLYATIGPADRGGVVLSGHTDVVPVDGQDWDTDPFSLVEKGGLIHGRGTTDMKGFIAVCLSRVPAMLKADLRAPVHLAFSYDEEIGCLGVPGMVRELAALPVKPIACIVGEPTGMRVVTGQKGKLAMRCCVAGHSAHSALTHQGVNAVEAAAEVIARIRAIARRMRDEGPFDPAYEPPHSSIHTGVVRGGTALNIIPNLCEFEFEVRALPGHDPHDLVGEVKAAAAALEPEMRKIHPDAGFRFTLIADSPGMATDEDAEVVRLARRLTGDNDRFAISFGTEASVFHGAGIPTVVCGPGSIEQAHKPNEFIAREQIDKCAGFVDRLIADLSSR